MTFAAQRNQIRQRELVTALSKRHNVMHLERVNRAAATASLAISQPCGPPCLLPGHAATGTTGSLPLRQLTVVGSAAVSTQTWGTSNPCRPMARPAGSRMHLGR